MYTVESRLEKLAIHLGYTVVYSNLDLMWSCVDNTTGDVVCSSHDQYGLLLELEKYNDLAHIKVGG